MTGPRSLLVTVALVVAGVAGPQLQPAAEAASTLSGPVMMPNDPEPVPRLVRTASIEPPDRTTCAPYSLAAALSADGHTVAFACNRYAARSDGGSRVVVLSDVSAGGGWRVTASISGREWLNPQVVALDADGRTLVIGQDDDIVIYARAGGTWQRTATVGDWTDRVDHVALSGDGGTLAVGTDFADHVRIYRRTATGWPRHALIESPVVAGAGFSSDALSMTGETLVVGAPFAHGEGAAYVYRRSGGTWRLLTTLTPPASDKVFGRQVAVSADGNTVAVDAGGEISVFRARAAGAAAFVRTARFGLQSDGFSLSADGRTVIAGNPNRERHGVWNVGRAYRFVRTGGGWYFGGVFDPRQGDEYYGDDVEVDATGRRVLVVATQNGRLAPMRADLYQQPATAP